MPQHLYMNMGGAVAIVLFDVGFTILLLQRNLIRKIMGINITDMVVCLFLTAKGYVEGRMVSIIVNGSQDPADYINPIPSGLVLTGIMVSVSVTALVLALAMRLYQRYGSLDLDKIIIEAQKGGP